MLFAMYDAFDDEQLMQVADVDQPLEPPQDAGSDDENVDLDDLGLGSEDGDDWPPPLPKSGLNRPSEARLVAWLGGQHILPDMAA